VQRVPFKIVFDDDAETLRGVWPGMSAEPTVTIVKPPTWLQHLL
jgi:membrane fusion protein, multidrug efflux system